MNESGLKTFLEELSSNLPYNELAVQVVKDNFKYIEEQLNSIKESVQGEEIPEDVSINYILLTFYKNRCIRILRTYRLRRLLFMQNLQAFAPEEMKIYKKLQKLEESYLANFNLNFNGTVPKSSFVKIVTLKDCGMVFDGNDLVDLKEGRIYFIRRKAVEHLLDGDTLRLSNKRLCKLNLLKTL